MIKPNILVLSGFIWFYLVLSIGVGMLLDYSRGCDCFVCPLLMFRSRNLGFAPRQKFRPGTYLNMLPWT